MLKDLFKKTPLEFLVLYVCCIFGIMFFVSLYFYKNRQVKIYSLPETDQSLMCCVDKCEITENSIDVVGWIFKQGRSDRIYDMSVILWNEDKCFGYVFPATRMERSDVTSHFNDGFEYKNSGFNIFRKNTVLQQVYEREIIDSGNYMLYLFYNNDSANSYFKTEEKFYVE